MLAHPSAHLAEHIGLGAIGGEIVQIAGKILEAAVGEVVAVEVNVGVREVAALRVG
jgi:hypothetical protein